MGNKIKTILITLSVILALTACESDDICGTVTGHSYEVTQYGEHFYLYVEGQRQTVTYNTWMNYGDGSEICLD